jgi:TPR repeat protein
MSKSLKPLMLGLAVAAAWEPALAQTAATDVAPVTVTAKREPPVELLPDINVCKAQTDPYVMAVRAAGGDLRIYQATRPPRNPDYNAPPRTPPGSALPEVMSLRDYRLYAARMRRAGKDQYREISRCLDKLEDLATSSPGLNDVSADGSASSLGPASGPDGRGYILQRDRTVPLAFALFDDGRYEEALDYFLQADSKLGNAEAKLQIGKIYLFGLKDKSDPALGVRWLKDAAGMRFNGWNDTPIFDPQEPERNTSLGEAAMILADVYGRGYGPVPKDPAQSRKYLERAYEVGHIAAAKMLGDIYYEGRDTPRDLEKAFDWYRNGAKFAHGPAMIALAQMYETGEAPGGADPKKALAWRTESAKRDNPAALYALAIAYDHGDGVEPDAERALALYKLAAMNGEPGAMTAIGTYFYRGEGGLERDLATARQWFEQGALSGDADGMFNLAVMQAKGEGGALDRVKAWGWFRIADSLGHAQAAAAARALEAQFTDADRAGVEALKRRPQPTLPAASKPAP